MTVESYSVVPLTDSIPAYVYVQYADDPDVQAFFAAYNQIAQGYLTWLYASPLADYQLLSAPLLDLIATYVYGMPRPYLLDPTTLRLPMLGYTRAGMTPVGVSPFLSTATSTLVNDAIYRSVLLWNLWRDARFNIEWVKRRVSLFLAGDPLSAWPSVTVSNRVFSVTATASVSYTNLQSVYASGALAFPAGYSMVFS